MSTAFTPWSALFGGLMIGAAATLLYASLGRIAGISGMLNAAIEQRDERGWRLAFLLALIVGAGTVSTLLGATPRQGFPIDWLVIGGLLVGFGTRLGNGCTSGHGICGLARLSPRSLVAVLAFMGAGFASVYLLRHATGLLP